MADMKTVEGNFISLTTKEENGQTFIIREQTEEKLKTGPMICILRHKDESKRPDSGPQVRYYMEVCKNSEEYFIRGRELGTTQEFRLFGSRAFENYEFCIK